MSVFTHKVIMMSDEINEIKHYFRPIRPKKDTEEILSNKRILAVERMKLHIENAVKDKESYYSKDHKRYIKSCDYLFTIAREENAQKSCTLVGDLCVSTTDFKNHYFKEVVGAGFAVASFVKSHDP